MKTISKKFLILFLAIVLAMMPLSGCKKDDGEKTPSVTLSRESCTITVGDSVTLTASAQNTDEPVVWSVSNDEIISVDGGVVTAYSIGSAVVTASAGTASKSCAVTVVNETKPVLEAGLTCANVYIGFTRAIENVRVTVGGKAVSPAPEIKFRSSDDSVATVSESGVITGVASGSVEITVSAQYDGQTLTKTFDVTVEQLDAFAMETEIVLSTGTKVYADDFPSMAKIDVTGFVNGAEITDSAELDWSIDDEDVATVDENGVITAVANGVAELTASIGEKEKKATVRVVPQMREKTLNDYSTAELRDGFNVTAASSYGFADVSIGEKSGTFLKITKEFSDSEATTTAAECIDFGVNFGVTNEELRQLKENGYSEIVLPLYIEYIRLRSDGKTQAGKDFINSLRFFEYLAGNRNQSNILSVPSGVWTETLTVSIDDVLNRSSGNTSFAAVTWHTDPTDTQSYNLYLGAIVAKRADNYSVTAALPSAVGRNMPENMGVKVMCGDDDITNDCTVSYESSNVSIVTVSPQGEVRGLAVGNAAITVKVASSFGLCLEKSFNVSVENRSTVTVNGGKAIVLSAESKVYFDDYEKTTNGVSFAATIDGVDYNDLTEKPVVTYSVQNTSVATVNAQTGALTAVAEGETTVTVKVGDDAQGTATVKVVPQVRELMLTDYSNVSGASEVTLGDVTGKFLKKEYKASNDSFPEYANVSLADVDCKTASLNDLYAKGYNKLNISVYLKYVSPDGSDLDASVTNGQNGAALKNYMSLKQNYTATADNRVAIKIYRNVWTDIELNLGEFIKEPKRNEMHVLTGKSESNSDCQSFELYIKDVTAVRDTKILSGNFDDTGIFNWNGNNYWKGWNFDIGFGAIEQGGKSFVKATLSYKEDGGSYITYAYNRRNRAQSDVETMTTLKSLGYNTVRFAFYTTAANITVEDMLAPKKSDNGTFTVQEYNSSWINGFGTSVKTAYKEYDSSYAMESDALTQNGWTNIDVPIGWVIARMSDTVTQKTKVVGGDEIDVNMILFGFKFKGLSENESVWVGDVTVVKKQFISE